MIFLILLISEPGWVPMCLWTLPGAPSTRFPPQVLLLRISFNRSSLRTVSLSSPLAGAPSGSADLGLGLGLGTLGSMGLVLLQSATQAAQPSKQALAAPSGAQ